MNVCFILDLSTGKLAIYWVCALGEGGGTVSHNRMNFRVSYNRDGARESLAHPLTRANTPFWRPA